MTRDEIEAILNKSSGLKGICGNNDMREVEKRAAEGDCAARLAIEMVCYRIKKYIGAYFAILGRLDALVFTAGIGEKSALIRERSCRGLTHMGISVDRQKNDRTLKEAFDIAAQTSTVRVLVIPTNEEYEIAKQTVGCIRKLPGSE